MLHERSPSSQPADESPSLLLPSASRRILSPAMEEDSVTLMGDSQPSQTATPQVLMRCSPPPVFLAPSDSKFSTLNLRPSVDHNTLITRPGPQLIGGLPCADVSAMKVFQEIPDNWYQNGSLGRSRQQEDSMMCECQYDPGDDITQACGEQSDCINRLTQVECLEDECRCRSHCQNQRFQRKQYSKLDIVQTEKKGFGLRAAGDIAKDAFIYEYVGEVISQPSFIKRMRQYAEEGMRHFYFMMLQRDEFIDATKKGGIGRFANHSCNPNCYVAKWVVGKKVRMGIFAKRYIKRDEELTFNYNVDRYGHDPQPCYCGEPRCVGFIGGKTQTDLSGMDDVYIDALGIAREVEELSLKGGKKKRAKKPDKDYMPVLKPMLEKEVSLVVNATRQTTSRKILYQLLTRIKITEDPAVLRQLARLRGLSLMHALLIDYPDDEELATLIMQSMSTWPLVNRNKVEDSRIEVLMEKFKNSSNDILKALAIQLLSQWSRLESVYRIPKRTPQYTEQEKFEVVTTNVILAEEDDFRPAKRQRLEEEIPCLTLKPMGYRPQLPLSATGRPQSPGPHQPTMLPRFQPSRTELAEIIAKAAAMQAQPPNPVMSSTAPIPTLMPLVRKAEKRHRTNGEALKSKGSASKSKEAKGPNELAKEANKEKRLLKLVGAVVVRCMSRYKDEMDHEVFKRNAKDLTTLIAEKEKKSSSYPSAKLDTLPDDKQAKIKKFVKVYVAKVLKKLREKERGTLPSTSTRPINRFMDNWKEQTNKHSFNQDPSLDCDVPEHSDQPHAGTDLDDEYPDSGHKEGVSSIISDIFGDGSPAKGDAEDDETVEDLDTSGPDESMEMSQLLETTSYIKMQGMNGEATTEGSLLSITETPEQLPTSHKMDSDPMSSLV